MAGDQDPGPKAPPRNKSEKETKEMSVEEQLPEERWRRVGRSGLLSVKESEEMTQSIFSSPRGS